MVSNTILWRSISDTIYAHLGAKIYTSVHEVYFEIHFQKKFTDVPWNSLIAIMHASFYYFLICILLTFGAMIISTMITHHGSQIKCHLQFANAGFAYTNICVFPYMWLGTKSHNIFPDFQRSSNRNNVHRLSVADQISWINIWKVFKMLNESNQRKVLLSLLLLSPLVLLTAIITAT